MRYTKKVKYEELREKYDYIIILLGGEHLEMNLKADIILLCTSSILL